LWGGFPACLLSLPVGRGTALTRQRYSARRSAFSVSKTKASPGAANEKTRTYERSSAVVLTRTATLQITASRTPAKRKNGFFGGHHVRRESRTLVAGSGEKDRKTVGATGRRRGIMGMYRHGVSGRRPLRRRIRATGEHDRAEDCAPVADRTLAVRPGWRGSRAIGSLRRGCRCSCPVRGDGCQQSLLKFARLGDEP